MQELGTYFLGEVKDGHGVDLDFYREKSESGKLILIHDDSRTYVYDNADYVDIVDMYSDVLFDSGQGYKFSEPEVNEYGDRLFSVDTYEL